MNSIDINKETIVKRSKVILVGLLLLVVIFVEVVPITFLVVGTGRLVLVWMVMVIGICIIFWLYYFFTSKPLLMVSLEGLFLEKTGMIPWSNIEQFRIIWPAGGGSYSRPLWLQINFRDKINGKSFVRMSTFFLPIKSKDLLEILNNYYHAFQSTGQ